MSIQSLFKEIYKDIWNTEVTKCLILFTHLVQGTCLIAITSVIIETVGLACWAYFQNSVAKFKLQNCKRMVKVETMASYDGSSHEYNVGTENGVVLQPFLHQVSLLIIPPILPFFIFHISYFIWWMCYPAVLLVCNQFKRY